MINDLIALTERHEYQQLFIRALHWSAPDHRPVVLVTDDGRAVTATNVSSYKGIRVWVCAERPGPTAEAALDRLIAKTSTDRLVIFHDDNGQQVWRWPVRRQKDSATTSRLTSHRHRTGRSNPKFAARLAAIQLPTDRALDASTVLGRVRAAFDIETQNETKRASALMSRMYAALERSYPSSTNTKRRDHEISVSLARILFLMFGDDTGMWAVDAFQTYVHRHTAPDGGDIGPRLNTLFEHLDTPSPSADAPELADFPYVNGGLFSERVRLPNANQEFRDAVLDACAVDWSDISPAIFGSMFQSVRDAQTRRETGEHYTSEENIRKTLEPLFLDELRAEFDRARATKQESRALNQLWNRLGDIRFLDPACGCGNFIIVSYRALRDLELDIMERLQEISGKGAQLAFDPTLSLKVTLDHFAGIEIDEWPARIAETAMFLVDRQCDLRLKDRFGEAPKRLPIQIQSQIVSGVSALQYDWSQLFPPSESVVVAGNPPFLGISLRSASQTKELQAVWASGYHGTLDYVTGWHAKTLDYYGDTAGTWAFVTTSSITQGEAVAPLFERILEQGWQIKFAHRTFRWTSEATGQAAVHCVIVGFGRGITQPRLFDYESPISAPVEVAGVRNITPYLTDGPTVIVRASTKPLNHQLGEVAYGNKPTDGGWLIVEPEDYAAVTADPIAAKYVRPYVGARELLHDGDRWCLWLVESTAADRRASRVLREHVAGVQAFRANSKAASTRQAADTPHLFRQLAQPSTPYLCIPAHVSETRPYFLSARFEPEVITSNANFLAPDDDGFMFAVISSSMFVTWQRTVGGRLESRLRFNKLLTWNTFPLPPTSNEQRRKIIAGGIAVLKARQLQPGTSLADMYTPGQISTALANAHTGLDQLVDAHFGLIATALSVSELQRQEVLFSKYQELAGGQRPNRR